MSKYTGEFPSVIVFNDVIADMKVWAKKIANEKYHYVTWSSKDEKTKTCPVCTGRKYDDHYGWNCIGFAFAIWHHGGHLPSKCNCHVIANEIGEKILKAKTDAEALKIAKSHIGLDDIQVIRNNGKAIPKSKAKAGDIALLFDGNTYKHTYFIMSDSKVADSTGSGSKENQIRADRNFDGRYVSGMKVIIRYTGKCTVTRKYLKKGDKSDEVKKLQKFLNWAINANLAVDGDFGDKTLKAVKDFQTKCKLTVDGYFGEASLKAAKSFEKADSTPTKPSTGGKVKMKGVDISYYQGNISVDNFKKAKAKGISFVILRLGYTGSVSKKPTLDSCFENNYKNAVKAGLPVGVYYYSLATTTAMAKKEAEYCIAHLKGKNIDFPVYIDMEDEKFQGKSSKATLASVCNTFCKVIKSSGYIAGVYANTYWFNHKIGKITAEHTKWVAQYYKKCEYSGAYDMWQYTSSENVAGIAKKTDVSWCYKDFSAIQIDYVVQPDENNVVDVDYVVEKEKTYSGTLPTLTLKKSNAEVIADAIRFALWIVNNNDFHYGYTSKDKKINAHHNGCYFCGTNTTKGGRSKKGIVMYEHTYCCNPFVHACWAHGGCVPKALEICQKGSSWDFNKGHGYDASSLFEKLGHPDMSKLKKGDVLCRDTHVALYIGDGKIAEAGGGDDNKKYSDKWNNSIRVRKLTKDNYKNFPRVYRFKGSVNASMPLRHGEVSDRVQLWQTFLNWYFKGEFFKQCGTADRYFGDNTKKWTEKFQKETGLTVDGIVGTKTLAKAQAVNR